MPLDLDSVSVQDYLKALYKLQRQHERISTNLLAERLAVAPASVTAMLKKLARAGLVDYAPYQGCRLTPEGERQALKMIRRHRIIEQFLQQMLHYRWDEVDAEAEVLEHAVSDKFIERLWHLLGQPTHDPHGAPIPDADGRLPAADPHLTPLTALAPGQQARIRHLCECPPARLRQLQRLHLRPGVVITLREHTPDMLILTTEHGACRLPHTLAQHVHVQPLAP